MKKTIKPITIEIDEDIWKNFKEQVPRTIRLNDKLVELITKETKQKGGVKK